MYNHPLFVERMTLHTQLMGKRFSAKQMHQFGFVNAIFPKENLLITVLELLKPHTRYTLNTTIDTKKLVRSDRERELLLETNEREFAMLYEKLISKEHADAVRRYAGQSSSFLSV
jgi:enoyl-CoA hydratase/carnithine racemase